MISARPAAAQPRSETDLSGYHVGLGPVAALARIEDTWDGGFGAEIVFVQVDEHRSVSALAIAAGAMQFTERSGGRLWVDFLVGLRSPLGGWVGLGIGPAVEVHEVRVPRWGGQATLWFYAGVTPYVRVGHVQNSGVFVDVGLKVVLPAIRW